MSAGPKNIIDIYVRRLETGNQFHPRRPKSNPCLVFILAHHVNFWHFKLTFLCPCHYTNFRASSSQPASGTVTSSVGDLKSALGAFCPKPKLGFLKFGNFYIWPFNKNTSGLHVQRLASKSTLGPLRSSSPPSNLGPEIPILGVLRCKSMSGAVTLGAEISSDGIFQTWATEFASAFQHLDLDL